jgi:hypothetical protein
VQHRAVGTAERFADELNERHEADFGQNPKQAR